MFFRYIVFVLLVGLLPTAALADPTATQLYVHALGQMRNLTQPPNATYTATFDAQGATFSLKHDVASGKASLGIQTDGGGKVHGVYQAVYRGTDEKTFIQTDSGEYARATFNPTWVGIQSIIRYGMSGEPQNTPAPEAQPSSTPDSSLLVIAVVSAIGRGQYNIHDAGAAPCQNGDPGYAVTLSPLGDGFKHPLTDAIIDSKTGDFCMLKFRLPVHFTFPHAVGSLQLNFGYIGNYYLVNDEVLETSAREFGIQRFYCKLTIAFSNFAFPKTVDSRVFDLPATSTSPAPRS